MDEKKKQVEEMERHKNWDAGRDTRVKSWQGFKGEPPKTVRRIVFPTALYSPARVLVAAALASLSASTFASATATHYRWCVVRAVGCEATRRNRLWISCDEGGPRLQAAMALIGRAFQKEHVLLQYHTHHITSVTAGLRSAAR
jgi:hypothetical protein